MNKTLASLTLLSAGVFASAQYNSMNHIDPEGAGLIPTPGFGVMQVFSDFPTFSGTVIDDFMAFGSTVTAVSVAYETSTATNLPQLQQAQWRISFWSSVANAANSGNNLDQNAVATALVGGATYTTIPGTGAAAAFRATFTGLNIGGLTAGQVYWIGMAPVMPFGGNGQSFILSHGAPSVLGNGTANNSVGVNPGNGFGLGTQVPVNTNAAYAVNTVPEPATMAVLGLGVAALIRRRKK